MSLAGITVLYGGSFNPPHLGHQMTCLYLLEGLGADAVWLIPASVHPFGKALASFEHRRAMCEQLAAALAPRVVVSDVERVLGGAGRTYDTLVYLTKNHPERRFALAIGADILLEAESWYRWRDIEAMVPIVVVGREGFDSGGRATLDMPAVSSSLVRERLRARESVEGLLPTGVIAYIAQHDLYRE